jgi:tetratricopeptide (TPR) repeat protein
MSKRRGRSKGARSKQGIATLRTRGSRYFHQGDYDQAIEVWERVRQQDPAMLPAASLAEAHFRRGLERLYGTSPDTESGLNDLHQALELRPDDTCMTYHLGLAAQRSGDLPTAIAHYEKVRQGSGAFARRAAYPLALALLQQGTDPSTAPIWGDLTENEQAMLRAANTFRRRPYTLDEKTPVLWQALVAIDNGKTETARQNLTDFLAASPTSDEAAIAHYYLGVLAAQREDWDTARKQWTFAHAQGYRSAHLSNNLGELYHRMAEERLVESDAEGALSAANEAARHIPDDNRLPDVLSQAHQRMGYQAAAAGQWERAFEHWDQARDLDGGSFRLAYNLALAHEKTEDFITAGEMWREALRRRPRKADHPDAITDEQVSLLWKRAAEAYVKGGEYEEAISVYKQAVKWNPDSLETRMALVDGLVNDGRLWAAENELNRILEKDEKYIPALLRMGEVLAESGNWWYAGRAIRYWEQVLALEPGNVAARQSLYDYYIDLGNGSWEWSNYANAIEQYNQALRYKPNDGHALALIGGCYRWMGQEATAQSYMDKALQFGAQDLQTYQTIIHIWIDAEDNDRAWKVMQQAEANVKDIPSQFYFSQAIYAMEVNLDFGRPWLDRGIELSPPDSDALTIAGQILALSPAIDVAQELLERALKAGQDVGRTTATLALLALRRGDPQTARRYLRDAEKIARKTRDPELDQQIQAARGLLDMPPDLLNMMLSSMGSGILDGTGAGGFPFPSFLDDDDDEEWDDDDGFINPFGY